MKNVIKIVLSVLVFSYISCSNEKNEGAENLTVDMGQAAGIIVPSPATASSCEQLAKLDEAKGNISGAYFTLPNPRISWTLAESPQLSEVRVVVLKLTLKSPKIGGDYSCIFSDTALGSMYYKRVPISQGDVDIKYWDTTLGRGSLAGTSTQNLIETENYTACQLKCGGLTLPDKVGRFSINGTWELIAVRRKYASETTTTDYEETPIKLQGNFSVENILSN